MRVLCLFLFCYALLCVHSSFEIILKRRRKLVTLLLLSYRCIVTINVLWLFLTVPWVGLQCAIVVFHEHTPYFFIHSTTPYIHLRLILELSRNFPIVLLIFYSRS